MEDLQVLSGVRWNQAIKQVFEKKQRRAVSLLDPQKQQLVLTTAGSATQEGNSSQRSPQVPSVTRDYGTTLLIPLAPGNFTILPT